MGVSLFSGYNKIPKIKTISSTDNTTSSKDKITTDTLDFDSFDVFDESNDVEKFEVSQEKIDYFTELLFDEEKYNNKIGEMSEEEYKEFVIFLKNKYSKKIDVVTAEIKFNESKLHDLNTLLKCDEDTLLLLVQKEENIKKSIDSKIVVAKTDINRSSLAEYGITEEDVMNHSAAELKKMVLNSTEYQEKINDMHKTGDRILQNTLKVYKQYSEFDGLTYNDILLLRDYYNNTITKLNTTKQGLENSFETAAYDHMKLLKGYNEFHAYKGIDADDLEEFTSVKTDQFGITFVTINYDKFMDYYPNANPLDFARAFKELKEQKASEGVKVDTYQVIGLENYNDYIELLEIEEYQKDLENGKEYPIPLASPDIDYAKIYEFLYEKDPREAKQFMKDISSVLKKYEGACMATSEINELGEFDFSNPPQFLLDYFNVTADGVIDGMYDFGEGFVKLLADGELSAQDYKVMMYMAYLAENDNRFGGILSLNKFYEGGQAVGMMLPVVTISALMSGVAPEVAGAAVAGTNVGQATSLGLMGLSTFGTTQNQLKAEGYDAGQAYKYALLAACSEALFEKYGGLIGLADVPGATVVQRLLKEGGQEAAQEVVQQIVGDSLILGKDISFGELTKDTFNAFIMGVVVAGSLNGYSKALSFTIDDASYTLSGEDQEALAKLLDTVKDPSIFDMNSFKSILNYSKEYGLDISTAINDLTELFSSVEDASSLHDRDYLRILEYAQKNNVDVITSMKDMDYIEDIINLDYSEMSDEEVLNVFSKGEVIELIKKISPDEFATVFKNISNEHPKFMSMDCFTDKIMSFSVEDLLIFSKEMDSCKIIPHNLDDQVNPENVYKVVDYLSDLFSDPNNYVYCYAFKDLYGNIAVSYDEYFDPILDDELSNKVDNFERNYIRMKNDIMTSIRKCSDVPIYCPSGFYFSFKDLDSSKYYSIDYEIDGISKVFNTRRNMISYDSFLYDPSIIESALNGTLKIKSISENTKKNNLIIDVQEGINYIKYEENGVEKEKIVLSYDNIYDLNNEINSDNNIVIKSVESIGDVADYKLREEDLNKAYKLKYKIDGIEYERLMFPERKNRTFLLDINNLIVDEHLFGAKDFEISETLLDLENCEYKYLKELPNSSELFSDEKFGGSQCDISDLVFTAVTDYVQYADPIYTKKSEFLLDLIKKYYPAATGKQMYDLSKAYSSNGCFYMAAANAYVSYCNSIEGGDRLFKEKIGFDLKTYDGNNSSLNVEALAFDMFLNKYYNLYGDNIRAAIKNGDGIADVDFYDEIVVQYFLDKGINVDYYHNGIYNVSAPGLLYDISKNPNSFMILTGIKYDIDISDTIKHVKTHAQLITGITDDNQIEISTWGQKAKFLLDSILGHTTIHHLEFK